MRLLPSQTLYFPSMFVKLVRSNLPPHQCVFFTKSNYNKFDLRDYLEKLYSLDIKDIRTMNYARKMSGKSGKREKSIPQYKKVIVTMGTDFVFPDPPSVKDDGCIRLPPRGGRVGKGISAASRKKINEQATERGIPLDTKA